MRKLNYGMFYDKYISSGDDYFYYSAPIGAHLHLKKMKAENKKTEGYHYFYKDSKGTIHIVSDPTPLEVMYAKTFGRKSPKEFIGFRNMSVYDKPTNELDREH